MRKKFLTFTLIIGILVSLTGCGNKISNDYVTVGQYKELKVSAVTAEEVSEDDIELNIFQSLQTLTAEYGVTDRAAELNDTVLIDYEGKIDGVAFEGGTATEELLTLGSGTVIEGFEEAIVGKMPGTTFDINVTFPEDYGSDDLNGKDAVFTITFHAISPTIFTDEMATALAGEEMTITEYKQLVREQLEVEHEEEAKSEYDSAVYSVFMANCEIKKYKNNDLETWVDIVKNAYAVSASYYDMSVDDFLEASYGVTAEYIAKEQILFQYAIELVAETENITITTEEYESLATESAADYGYESLEDYKTNYEELYGEGSLKIYFLQLKVMEWIIDSSVAV